MIILKRELVKVTKKKNKKKTLMAKHSQRLRENTSTSPLAHTTVQNMDICSQLCKNSSVGIHLQRNGSATRHDDLSEDSPSSRLVSEITFSLYWHDTCANNSYPLHTNSIISLPLNDCISKRKQTKCEGDWGPKYVLQNRTLFVFVTLGLKKKTFSKKAYKKKVQNMGCVHVNYNVLGHFTVGT